MRFIGKRFLAFVLAFVLTLGLFPSGVPKAAAAPADALTEADYAQADLVFDRIDAVESSPAKKNATTEQKLEAAKAVVMASSSYVEGSLDCSGNSFTWWTEEGIRCVYSPRMREIKQDLTPEKAQNVIVNEPRATKNGSPSGKQVYLIGPYYGSDENFTNQYKNEARRVAAAIGDTDSYTLYSGSAATIDKVAEAVSNGAVVFFDSHGTTDYENPDDEYDFITGANYSYLCLSTTSGVTNKDYNDGAYYDGEGAWVNGTNIANHMTKNSPGGILWMAICLGMGTDTLFAPLRNKGVEVVYGYSESVSFDGDYLFEETFWEEMLQGKTVAQSISAMKSQWGNWDWSVPIAEAYGDNDGYATITEARDDFIAFPVVVSDEDTFAGKRTAEYQEYDGFYGADSLQTVQSTYSLGEIFEVTSPTDPKDILEEAYALAPGEELPYEATLTGTITSVTTAYNSYYGNVTVIMEVPGYPDMPVKCYRLSGNGVDRIGVGDTITVTGTIINFQHSSGDTEVEFAQGCVLTSWSSGSSAPTDPTEPTDPDTPDTPVADNATLSFADAANRVEWDAQHQLWRQNGITVLNEKANSNNDVANYVNPARFYKNSSLTISADNMVQIDINCASSSYSGAMAVAVPTSGGVKAQVSGSTVTITLPAPTDSFCIPDLSGGQVRIASIKVYTQGSSQPTDPTDPPEDPTEPTDPIDPSVDYVTAPAEDTAYKFRVDQKTAGKVLYLTGEMDGYYFATTEDINEAVDVYLEEVSGGYRVYFLKNSVKHYLEIVQNGTYTNVVFTTTPTKTLKWNSQIASVTCDVEGEDYYFGSYKTYVTFSASNISYVTGSNADTFDKTNFVAHFVEAGGEAPAGIPGDLDGDGRVSSDDVVSLLLHISMPDMFQLPAGANADFTGDTAITTDDAVKLLLHISMPDMFPL